MSTTQQQRVVLTESNFSDVEVLSEKVGDTDEKNWFLNGTFLQADVVNRNRRIYPLPIMEKAVSSYERDYVQPKRAVGELSHPDTTQINLDKITHITESIKKEGKNFIGKAKILNTPCGNIVRGLIEGGVRLGVSSRGFGSVQKNTQGISEVQGDYNIAAIDIVYQPSAPDAFVEGLMEGASFVWDTVSEDTEFVEMLKESMKNAKKENLQEKKLETFIKFMSHLGESSKR